MKKRNKRVKILKGEKMIYTLILLAVISFEVQILFTYNYNA